jgi:hypothetical protein
VDIAALITLDGEALASWKRAAGNPEQAGPAELRDDPELLASLQTAVDEANQTVSRAESIRKFRVLPFDLTEQDGYLTPTPEGEAGFDPQGLRGRDRGALPLSIKRRGRQIRRGASDGRRWTDWWRPPRRPATAWSTPPAPCASSS